MRRGQVSRYMLLVNMLSAWATAIHNQKLAMKYCFQFAQEKYMFQFITFFKFIAGKRIKTERDVSLDIFYQSYITF